MILYCRLEPSGEVRERDRNLGPKKISATKNHGSRSCAQHRKEVPVGENKKQGAEGGLFEVTKARRRESLKGLRELKNMSKDAGWSSNMRTGN